MIRRYAVEIYVAGAIGLLLAAVALTGIALANAVEAPVEALWMLAGSFGFGILALVASEVRAGVMQKQ